jgi:flagellar hook-associated protein 2
MAITASGIGSGLDVNSIISQLMTLERRPITLLDKQEASYKAKLSAFGTIKSALAALQAAAKALASPAKFASFQATVADATVLNAAAGPSAAAGSYSVQVHTLAQNQKLVAVGQVSDTAVMGTGGTTTLTFEFGAIAGTLDPATGKYSGATFTPGTASAQTVTIDAANNTLQGIRDAINAANIGVTASIINDGSATPYRLVLTSNNSGVESSMRIAVSADPDIAALLAHDPAGSQALSERATASDASFSIDGIAITKPSNTVADAIGGVTLTLLKPNSSTTFNVASDTAAIQEKVDAFVKAYNDLSKALRDATAADPTAGTSSALTGDSTVRSIQSQMRQILTGALAGTTGALTRLADVGIAFQRDGTLAVDATKLTEALADPTKRVGELFVKGTAVTGFAAQIDIRIEAMLSTDGLVASRTDGINDSIRDIGKRRERIEARLVQIEARYRAQFTALDTMIASMNKTSEFLQQQLANLPKIQAQGGN